MQNKEIHTGSVVIAFKCEPETQQTIASKEIMHKNFKLHDSMKNIIAFNVMKKFIQIISSAQPAIENPPQSFTK